MKPKEIRKGPSGLQIIWCDQKLEVLDYARLRANCACAVCREFVQMPNYAEPRFERSRQIHSMELIGNYALGMTWADGHKSIYAFDRLREAA